jgi:DNA-binding transcriptional regulator YiaG
MSESNFVRGNGRLAQLKARPGAKERIAKIREDADEADRIYAMSLAMIRQAGELTQVEVAERLKVGQGVVSKLERRDDMLLSTLFNFLEATGAEDARIVVTVKGQDVELDLPRLRAALR